MESATTTTITGRGRGRFKGTRDIPKDPSRAVCFRCDKVGHFAYKCPDRLLKLQETQESEKDDTQEADKLMMHEIVYLNEGKIVPSNYESQSQDVM